MNIRKAAAYSILMGIAMIGMWIMSYAAVRSILGAIVAAVWSHRASALGHGLLAGAIAGGSEKTAAGIARWLHADEQALQQFMNQSPWDWMRVRSKLARQMVQFVSPACAWVVDDTGFPKKGKHSVGVARQYSGTLGKVGNCQLAVSLNYATDEAHLIHEEHPPMKDPTSPTRRPHQFYTMILDTTRSAWRREHEKRF